MFARTRKPAAILSRCLRCNHSTESAGLDESSRRAVMTWEQRHTLEHQETNP